MRPSISAEILRISGRGNCKEAFLLLGEGFPGAKIVPSPPYMPRKNRPVPAVHAAEDDESVKRLRPSRTLLRFFDGLPPAKLMGMIAKRAVWSGFFGKFMGLSSGSGRERGVLSKAGKSGEAVFAAASGGNGTRAGCTQRGRADGVKSL